MRRMRSGTNRCSPQRRQHGAVAVFVAISLVAILAAVALSIDIARLYYAQRDLQRLATLSALSAAQIASGCANNGVPGSLADAEAEVTSIIARNNPSGTVIGTGGINGSPYVELGKVETATDGTGLRGFKPLADGDANIDSVRVNLTTTAPARLLPFLGTTTNNTLYASATATQSALGSLSVGSGVASLQQGLLNSVLSAAVGGNVNLSVADFTGLSNVNVTASQLATALGISVTDLSDPTTLNQTVALGAALSGLTSALSGGVVNPQVISILQNLAGLASSNTTPIPLDSILNPVGTIAGAVPFANLQDVLMALALASQANTTGGPKPIQLNNIGADVPGVAAVKAYATVIQPPKLSGLGRAGQTSASTAQVKLQIRIAADGAITTALKTAVTGVLNGLLGTLGALLGLPVPVITLPNPLNIGVDVVVAPATAYLDKLVCPSSSNPSPTASLSAQTGLATVNVGTFNSAASAPQPLSTVSPWTVLDANLDASHVCVGLNLLHLCLTYANLGKTDIQVNLDPTALGVSPSPRTNLSDVTQFTAVTGLPAGTAPTYLANNPGTTDTNPQTISAPTSASLSLGLDVTHTGSGLIDSVSGLVSGLVSAVTSVLNGLLNVVNGLLTSLINPLLSALGVGLGNATVTMETVTVARPAITSECLPGAAAGSGQRGCPAVP